VYYMNKPGVEWLLMRWSWNTQRLHYPKILESTPLSGLVSISEGLRARMVNYLGTKWFGIGQASKRGMPFTSVILNTQHYSHWGGRESLSSCGLSNQSLFCQNLFGVIGNHVLDAKEQSRAFTRIQRYTRLWI
jgi:hypothetical protein